MSADDKETAIFGAADGLTSTVAVVIAQLITGSRHSLIAGGFAIAIAAGVGMGWSQWLGDRSGSARRAGVMAAATLLASTAPIVPFLVLWKAAGVIACALVATALIGVIAYLRCTVTTGSRARALAVTVGGLLIVSALVSLPSVLVG
jgi:hypothetical protein